MNSKNLSLEAPRSPRIRIGGYAIIGRTIDKCRAMLAGTLGDFHYDCPLDNMLFGFKGVTGAALKAEVEKGLSDEQLAAWLDTSGTKKTAAEVKQWSDAVEASSLYSIPEKREFFSTECKKLGLDPERTSTFTWLEADDTSSFKKSA